MSGLRGGKCSSRFFSLRLALFSLRIHSGTSVPDCFITLAMLLTKGKSIWGSNRANLGEEGKGLAWAASTTGAADTMNVGGSRLREVVVDDCVHAWGHYRIPLKSIPRASSSVVMSTQILPSRKAFTIFSRCECVRSACMSSTGTPGVITAYLRGPTPCRAADPAPWIAQRAALVGVDPVLLDS
jgi:hypothetical protein